MGSSNNHNIAPKIKYRLLACRCFHNFNRNIIFLLIIPLCSITLILSLSSALLNSFYSEIKSIYWSVLLTFLIFITLILSLSSALLNSFYTKIKTIYWCVLITCLIFIIIMFIKFTWVHALLSRQSGDIEMNQRPEPNPCHSFSIFH